MAVIFTAGFIKQEKKCSGIKRGVQKGLVTGAEEYDARNSAGWMEKADWRRQGWKMGSMG